MAEEIDLLGQLKFASQHLLNLAVFIGILYYFLRKPVSSFFVARSQKIESSINSAKDIIETAQKVYDENSSKFSKIDSEISELRDNSNKVDENKVSEIMDNANSLVKLIERDTVEIIELESKKINNQIEDEILNKAVKLAEYELSSEFDESKDTQIIKSFLGEVRNDVVGNN
ncbi:MAG: ATP synthase F0 subunit B [Thermodesulfobacteriota bacterium]|nr:ATP synthase F0 subunit B [Thermodesulfobacteriota bacterium]